MKIIAQLMLQAEYKWPTTRQNLGCRCWQTVVLSGLACHNRLFWMARSQKFGYKYAAFWAV